MKPLLTPKLDLVFKLLLTGDPAILLDLVNTVLASPEHLHIQSLEVKNPTILPEELDKKFIILDILAVDDRHRRYDIEMQVQSYGRYPERTLYYLSKLYAGQLDAGEDYTLLHPVIGIHFLDYEQFPTETAWQWSFELRDRRDPAVRLTDHFLLHLVELPKFERVYQQHDWGQALFEWVHFLNHAHEEGEPAMQVQYQHPAIHKAFRRLAQISADEETRRRAEIRENALKNEASMLSAAKAEGRAEGRTEGIEVKTREVAKKALQEGLPIDLIIKLTGLAPEELAQLRAAAQPPQA
jgi:predicted transposase/invertase (TIGR01784 family)